MQQPDTFPGPSALAPRMPGAVVAMSLLYLAHLAAAPGGGSDKAALGRHLAACNGALERFLPMRRLLDTVFSYAKGHPITALAVALVPVLAMQ